LVDQTVVESEGAPAEQIEQTAKKIKNQGGLKLL